MPATEQTWRNQKVLHIVFGATTLVMVFATLWLLAKDHSREWKNWQLADRKKDAWMISAQRDSKSQQFAETMDTLSADITKAESAPVDVTLVDRFKALIVNEKDRRKLGEADFKALDDAIVKLSEASAAANEAIAKVEENAEEADKAEVNAANRAQQKAVNARTAVMDELAKEVSEAIRVEKGVVAQRKAVAADRTATVSELGLKVGEGASSKVREQIQQRIDGYTETIGELTAEIATCKDYRVGLEAVVRDLDAEKTALGKEQDTLKTELARLQEQADKNTTNPLEWVTRWPVLNALYDGNVRIDQIWLPELTVNFNFSQVARFDRCKSCHQAISQTAPGTADQPAYPPLTDEERDLTVSLMTPDEAPAGDATVLGLYGMEIAPEGVINYADVTVHYVLPGSAAARAGLQSGDIIVVAGDRPVHDRETAKNFLLKEVTWGEPASLSIKRGFDHPFVSHPRLDLYLTDSSPHSEKKFGCTICHDGQGSGTAFRWASHTPDNAKQQAKWTKEYGWFDNHHWIFPMKPARFAESNCTKCHHDKGSLEPSQRFPEPPAPKLVEGWSLVEKYGCFGCHEIGGFDGPNKRIGPDVRLEPNYSEVASQILRDGGLTEEQQGWAKTLIDSPDNDSARHQLLLAINTDAKADDGEAVLSEGTHKLTESLKDVEAAGQYRKPGPSLRFLKSKVDFQWLHSWISEPANFRPSTRMPQFFGLHEHLKDAEDADELAMSERYEPVEIRAMTEFLLSNSSEFEYLQSPTEVTETPSAERGKWLFESRGCLACHSHDGFEGIASDQGPDLSRVASKFNTEKGAQWLYSWIKKPNRYHVRTKMPDLFLDPIVEIDAAGQPTGKVTDPAADIAAFLTSGEQDWKPAEVDQQWSAEEQEALADLAQEWLTSDAIPSGRAKKFVNAGIPEHLEPRLKSDEKILIGITDENRISKLQEYVARRSISKYGCFGCHDIPGFEGAKPIGTPLAEWGRKETSKLAFENIHKFLEGHGHPNAGAHDAADNHAATDDHAAAGHGDDEEHASHGHLDPGEFDDDTSYYVQSLNSHARDGFIWQKLRMPRSYDYKTTKNKGYNERLRMPKFPFDKDEREAVITFVLGLVNEAPADQFVYNPDPRQKAIVEGRQVLEKFNCAGCHTLEMEQWKIAFDGEEFESPAEIEDFPFLEKQFDAKEIAASLETDSRGLQHATIHGLPVLSETTGKPELVDEDGLPLEPDDDESDPFYMFTLWKDAVINGESWLVGLQNLMLPASRDSYGPADGAAYPAWGGDLAKYLYPKAIAKAKEINPQVKGAEAWGWLPPPLMDEGDKVQTTWLHDFLMDPTEIRPAAIMRMPNFRMSAADAEKLVNYFAAVSGAEFPYEYSPRQRPSYLASMEDQHQGRLSEAMNIVVNGNYCVKCHGVSDFMPQGDRNTFGPNLAEVYRRLRPEYVRDWIANPKRILPYTGMPVNIPFPAGISQDLYHGTSLEQLDGLVDVLMNFDVYTKKQTSVTQLVEQAKAASAPAAEAEGEGEEPEEDESAQTSDASPKKAPSS